MQQPPPPLRADVMLSTGETYHVAGRVARMVLWLCQQQGRIEACNKGDVTLSFGGTKVAPRLLEVFDPLE